MDMPDVVIDSAGSRVWRLRAHGRELGTIRQEGSRYEAFTATTPPRSRGVFPTLNAATLALIRSR